MKDVIDLLLKVKGSCIVLSQNASSNLNITEDSNPVSFFSMAHNKIVLSVEMLSFYCKLWAEYKYPEEKKQSLIIENGERVLSVQKALLIEIFSSLEFSLKNAFLHGNSLFDSNDKDVFIRAKKPSRLYLSGVIDKTKEKGIIDENEYSLWKGLNKLRNSIVHNNAIQEITETYDFGKTKLVLVKDQQARGDLLMLVYLIEWMVEKTYEWINKCLVK